MNPWYTWFTFVRSYEVPCGVPGRNKIALRCHSNLSPASSESKALPRAHPFPVSCLSDWSEWGKTRPFPVSCISDWSEWGYKHPTSLLQMQTTLKRHLSTRAPYRETSKHFIEIVSQHNSSPHAILPPFFFCRC